MMRENPRALPPSWMTAHQSVCTSGDVCSHDVKSGYVLGFSNPTVESAAPDPWGPWHPAHPAANNAAPSASPSAGRVWADAAVGAATTNARPKSADTTVKNL